MSLFKSLFIVVLVGLICFSINGCSKGLSEKTSKEMQPKTKEPISFKGIPLGKPGVKDALKQLCLADKSNIEDNSCSFKENSNLIWLTYGFSISGHSLARIYLNNDDALESVEITGLKQEMLALAETLTEKYGVPVKKKVQIENGFGTKFDNEIFVWVDNQGSRITVESIFSKISEGRVVIESANSVATKDFLAKQIKEIAKSKL